MCEYCKQKQKRLNSFFLKIVISYIYSVHCSSSMLSTENVYVCMCGIWGALKDIHPAPVMPVCRRFVSHVHVCVYMCMCAVHVHVCVYMCMCACTCACVRVHVHVCVYMCMCACTCACVRVHVHVCVYMCMCACTCACVRVHVHECVYMCMCACTCACVRVHVHVCVYMYTCTCTRTCTYMHIHTDTHVHTHRHTCTYAHTHRNTCTYICTYMYVCMYTFISYSHSCRRELRCVVGIIRHGDRTPKQKMKMVVTHQKFFTLFEELNGFKTGKVKLKKPKLLQVSN